MASSDCRKRPRLHIAKGPFIYYVSTFSDVLEFQRWWVLKGFWPRINILEGNLKKKFRSSKIGHDFRNKLFFKLKMFLTKVGVLNWYSSMKKLFGQIRTIFDIKNQLSKYDS